MDRGATAFSPAHTLGHSRATLAAGLARGIYASGETSLVIRSTTAFFPGYSRQDPDAPTCRLQLILQPLQDIITRNTGSQIITFQVD